MKALLLALTALATTAASPPTATVDAGRVSGVTKNGTQAFLGIPYAADTGGANRWRAPRPVKRWSRVRRADAFGPNCYQGPPYHPPGGSPWTAEFLPVGPMSEDCLSLNVWTPAKRGAGRLPVMVWIHGGGFGGGSSTVPIYDGAALAARGVVVVTINYRVSVFGFLTHPALTAEAGSSGNYGLMDQIAALRWVRRNIAAFGGDPAAVTIAGQSAGAASVHYLLAAAEARGLFRRAIAESGSGMGLDVKPRTAAEALGSAFANAAHAPTLAALRAAPAEALLAAVNDPTLGPPGLRFQPIREPAVLPDPARQDTSVPVLTGLAADEASAGDPAWRSNDASGLARLLRDRFAARSAAFAPLYGGDPTQATRAVLKERGIAAMLFWTDARPAGAAPVYGYRWSHAEPGPDFGAFHTVEVPYVFGNLIGDGRAFTASDRRIADQTQRYWINFVRSGDPNGAGLPRWPALASGEILDVGDTMKAVPALAPAKRAAYRAYVDAGGTLSLF